jgi:hypothetical protein
MDKGRSKSGMTPGGRRYTTHATGEVRSTVVSSRDNNGRPVYHQKVTAKNPVTKKVEVDKERFGIGGVSKRVPKGPTKPVKVVKKK